MKTANKITALALLATTATAALAPVAVLADSHQGKKNTGRNLGIAGAAIAGYGLLKHNTAATVLGGVGAVAGAKMYEDNRKAQSRNNSRRHYFYRNGHRYYRSY